MRKGLRWVPRQHSLKVSLFYQSNAVKHVSVGFSTRGHVMFVASHALNINFLAMKQALAMSE